MGAFPGHGAFHADRPITRAILRSINISPQVAAGHRPSISAKVPPAVAALIDACWAGNPDLRPGMAEVVRSLKVRADGIYLM